MLSFAATWSSTLQVSFRYGWLKKTASQSIVVQYCIFSFARRQKKQLIHPRHAPPTRVSTFRDVHPTRAIPCRPKSHVSPFVTRVCPSDVVHGCTCNIPAVQATPTSKTDGESLFYIRATSCQSCAKPLKIHMVLFFYPTSPRAGRCSNDFLRQLDPKFVQKWVARTQIESMAAWLPGRLADSRCQHQA